jgi:hypothetical protein
MASSWGLSWARAWGNSWGLLTTPTPPTGGGGGGGSGWVLQQFIKRPWEIPEVDKRKIVKDAYRELVEMEVSGVTELVAPFRVPQGIDWTSLLADLATVKSLVLMDIRLKQKMDEDAEEEEALILLLSY